MSQSALVSDILTTLLIVVHSILVVIDFLGLYPMTDFMKRSDGSRMDPRAMLPSEKLFVAMLAFPFLTILLAFLFCTSRRDAALISFATHSLYAMHQIWNKGTWDAIMHPGSDMSTEFFIYSHISWAIVSVIIVVVISGKDTTFQEIKPKVY